MNRRLKVWICLAALAAAPGARAQDVVDPIGSLLDQLDEETAETRGVGVDPVPPAPPAAAPPTFPYTTAPYSPAYPAAPPGQRPPAAPSAQPYRVAPAPGAAPYTPPSGAFVGAPVNVDDYDRTPERPLNSVEQGYENRMRASFASAQGMQGPMDGGWTLRGQDGRTLYAFLFVDKNQPSLEGAWRDPRRPGAADASGFFTVIQRSGGQVTASFYPRPGEGEAGLSLSSAANGEWRGELTEGGRRTSVVLRRD